MKKRVADIAAFVVTVVLLLLTALAWNSVIQDLIRKHLGAETSSTGVIAYAVIITVVTILIIVWLHKTDKKIIKNDKKDN